MQRDKSPRENIQLPPVDVRHLLGPSVAAYRALIAALMLADQKLASGVHPQLAYIDAMAAVCRFVGSDDLLRLNSVSTTLRQILADLEDTAAGARPNSLFGGGARRKGKGRPTNLTSDTLRGCMVGGLNKLIEAGQSNAAAAQWLAGTLASVGARYRGKHITADQLLQWREQTGDTAPQLSDEAVRHMALIRGPAKALTLEEARRFALAIALTVVRWNSK